MIPGTAAALTIYDGAAIFLAGVVVGAVILGIGIWVGRKSGRY